MPDPNALGAARPAHMQVAAMALRIAADEGAERVTVRRVACALGIPPATLGDAYRSDAALRAAAFEALAQRMTAAWEMTASAPSPLARLRSTLGVQLGIVMATPAIRALLFSCEAHRGDAVLRDSVFKLRQRFEDFITQLLDAAKDAGEIPAELDSAPTARRIVEVLQGMIMTWSLGRHSTDLVDEAWRRLDILLRGSVPRRRAPRSDAPARRRRVGER